VNYLHIYFKWLFVVKYDLDLSYVRVRVRGGRGEVGEEEKKFLSRRFF